MELTHVTPKPDEAERQAILAALAAEQATRARASRWAETVLPARGGQEDEP
jgi:hypothetical protein